MKFSLSSRLFVNAIWCGAFGTALFVMLAHRPEALAPKMSLDTGPNEYLTETLPLRAMFAHLEHDLTAGTVSLEEGITTAESFMENSLQKEGLRDFLGDTERERISHMLLLWVERNIEGETDPALKERLKHLGEEHERLFPASAAFPASRRH
ncbi:MAG: hypothetical protein K2X38_02670 [Gemmataceae bacterium]|nr:hypothetical protein [Gemmataceae bacterium]